MSKRQLTWLRGIEERIVVDCVKADATEDALKALETVMAGQ